MNYCSACGSDQLKEEIPLGDNRKRFCCKACGTIHYSNPKLVTGCLLTYEDKILLCERAIEPRKGFWTFPSGFMENGETAEEGAAREAYEEAYAEAKIVACTAGAIWDVGVDLRPGSPTRFKWFGAVLTPENGLSLVIPEVFR